MKHKKLVRPSGFGVVPKFVYGAILGTVAGLAAVLSLGNAAVIVAIVVVSFALYMSYMAQQLSGKGRKKLSTGKLQSSMAALVVVGMFSVVGAHFFNETYAWHPNGKINKTVKNETTGSVVTEANNASTAVTARPGDVLTYTITVSNIASPAANQDNDMAYTVMTDTLPAGVELVGNPGLRNLNENMGTILPGKAVVKIYQVKVTSTTDGAVLVNKACFTGDSVVRDNAQSGCDNGVTVVDVPPTPTTPTPTPPTPVTPVTPTPPGTPTTPPVVPVVTTTISVPTELPEAGPGQVGIIAVFAVAGGYILHTLYRVQRKR
jgi:uncharacterized repeat protein (TIGR01451 family)